MDFLELLFGVSYINEKPAKETENILCRLMLRFRLILRFTLDYILVFSV